MMLDMVEGRRLRTKLAEGDYYSEQSERNRVASATKGSAKLRDAILLAQGIVTLPIEGPLPLPKEPIPEPCELCGAPIRPRLLTSHIMATVAAYYDIPAASMTGSQQYAKIARQRQVAMYLSSELTSNSLSEIGRRFNRDHTTVMHALKAVEKRMDDDPQVLIDVEVLRERLGG